MKRSLGEIINLSKKYESEELSFQEIKWLIEATLNIQEYQLISDRNEEFDDEILFERLEKARHVPTAYILNECMFLGNVFYVDNNVLIPRNETEELVLLVKDFILKHNLEKVKVCDIGTGSGCIAISLKKDINSLNMTAVDISMDALKVAKKNALKLHQDIKFVQSDCFDALINDFEIVVSNPPYIDKNNFVHKRVLNNEPHLALFADNKGLSVYEKILLSCSLNQNLKGIFFEISPEQIDDLTHLGLKYLPTFEFNVYKDMNGFERFVSYIKN